MDIETGVISVTIQQEQPLCHFYLQSAKIITLSPSEYTLQINPLEVSIAHRPVLSLPALSLSLMVQKQPDVQIGTLREILTRQLNTPTQFLVQSMGDSPYYHFFKEYQTHPLFSLKGQLPPLVIHLHKEAIQTLLSLSLLPSPPLVSVPSFSRLSFEMPVLSINVAAPSIQLLCHEDICFHQASDAVFATLFVEDFDLQLVCSSQNMNLSMGFSSLSIRSSFCHSSPPLTLESLTGFDASIETSTWETRCASFKKIPAYSEEIIHIQSSQIHIDRFPHAIPSLYYSSLLSDEANHSSILLYTISTSCTTHMQFNLGLLDIVLDDLVLADLVWTVITIINLYWIQVPEDQIVETPDWMIDDGSLVFQIESPITTITLAYDHEPFQELCLPNAYFEFSFIRHELDHTLTPSNFECGLKSGGIYWTDLTIPFVTNQVIIWIIVEK